MEKMMSRLIMTRIVLQDKARKFMTEESGDTNFISIIIIAAIVVALAGVLYEVVSGGIGLIGSKITTFVNGN